MSSITSDILRGHTETIILKNLLTRDSYGYEINRSIQEQTNNEFELKDATLYSAFQRLEKSGYIESYWGDENIGARRKYYRITTEGKIYYEISKQAWEKAKQLIDSLI